MPIKRELQVPYGKLDKPLRPNMEPIHALCDYDPRFCNTVHELGKTGATYAQMCAAIGTSKKRSDVWRSKYEEYDEALHAGLTAAEAFYAEMGARNIEWTDAKQQPQFRDTVWKDLKSDFKTAVKEDDKPTEETPILSDDITKFHKDTI